VPKNKRNKKQDHRIEPKKYLKTVFLEVIGGNSVLFAQSKE